MSSNICHLQSLSSASSTVLGSSNEVVSNEQNKYTASSIPCRLQSTAITTETNTMISPAPLIMLTADASDGLSKEQNDALSSASHTEPNTSRSENSLNEANNAGIYALGGAFNLLTVDVSSSEPCSFRSSAINGKSSSFSREQVPGDLNTTHAVKQYDVCIIHSGSEIDNSLEHYITKILHKLDLTVGPMDYDSRDGDTALLNANLKTISQSEKVVLIFSKNMKRHKCRIERLYALLLHSHNKRLPILIPIAVGGIKIPDKYSIVHPLLICKSLPWTKKLFHALMENTLCEADLTVNETVMNDGIENFYTHLDKFTMHQDNEIPLEEEDDFDEFGTGDDTLRFEVLDRFLKDTFVADCSHSEDLKEVLELQDRLCNILKDASPQTRLTFSRMNSKGGLFPYISQMGLNNVHKILIEGCGMNIQNNAIILKWKSFEQNLLRNNVTLADVVNFSRFTGIRQIAIRFNKASHDLIEKHYGTEWRKSLVMFAERVLRFQDHEYQNEILTYNILMNGVLNEATKSFVNETGRSLFIDDFKNKSEWFGDVDNRLQTYETWPFETTLKKSDLAEIGFIYSGEGDTITCHACNQSLYGMSTAIRHAEKDPEHSIRWYICLNHAFYNDHCTFLKSLPQYGSVRDRVLKIKMRSTTDPYQSAYSTDTSRLDTFDKNLSRFRCLEFAKAGFVMLMHSNGSILVECFYCSTQINSMRLSQDPWIEHVRWSPKCKFVEDIKGKDFIEDTLNLLKSEDADLDDTVVEFRIVTHVIKPTLKHH